MQKMNRVKWKGPYIEKNLLENIKDSKSSHKNSVKTMSKNSIILPSFVELTFRVYNGKVFAIVKIINEMVGHKLGEFVSTRKQFSYKKKKNK
jgi:small subunit ribosomal protein S19